MFEILYFLTKVCLTFLIVIGGGFLIYTLVVIMWFGHTF